MGELWQSIESAVVAALLGLIPVIGAAAAAWLRARKKAWDQDAEESLTEAAKLSASVPENIPADVEELWARHMLQRRQPKLSDEKALGLVRKAAERVGSGSTPLPPPPPPAPPVSSEFQKTQPSRRPTDSDPPTD